MRAVRSLRNITRRLRSPVGILAVAGLAGLVSGGLIHPHGYLWFLAAAAMLAMGLVWPRLVIAGIRGELRFEAARCREDGTVRARLLLRRRRFFPWSGLRFEGDGQLVAAIGACGEAGVAQLARRATLELLLEVRPVRFGDLPASALVLTCGFPFGIWHPRRVVENARGAIAWPATHPVGPVPETDAGQPGARASRRVGIGGEPCGVRPFRQGDRLRLVHWPQSARYDRLMVRETLVDATPRVRVGLSTRRDLYGSTSAFDDAVRQAASYVEGWTRAGSVVELSIGPTHQMAPRSLLCSPNAMPRAALDALSRLRLADLPDFAALPHVDVLAHVAPAAGPRTKAIGGAA